jgi:dTDP-4-amino-4,6-dideoxygalactose transaminase
MSSILKKIPYVNLKNQWELERDDLLPIIDKVLSSGKYVGGEEVEIFEESIAKFCDVKYSVALNSGTDALTLSLHLLGVKKGDEVITTPNSFIASTAVIVHLGAKPVFVDVLPDQNMDPEKLENAILDFSELENLNSFVKHYDWQEIIKEYDKKLEQIKKP